MLTEKKIEALTKPGRYKAEPTLFLLVSPNGTKSWLQRIYVYKKRRELGLGGWPVVSLEKARRRAFANRVLVEDGGDPLITKPKDALTLKEAAEQYYTEHKPQWKPGRAAEEWPVPLERYVYPKCGQVPVNKLAREHLLLALKPLWAKAPETARKLKGRVSLILKWCIGHGYVTHNVAEQITAALPATPASVSFKAVPYKRVGEVWAALGGSEATSAARLCLRFLLLTAVRSQEARLATWDEIDTEEGVWEIPGHRMKKNAPHRVPLSHQALHVLFQAKALGGTRYVFPSPVNMNEAIGHATPRKAMVECGMSEATTIHGFRSIFRTWAQEETTAPWEILELCLAHKVGTAVSRAYARGDALDKRRPIMQQWSDFVAGTRVRLRRHPGE